jgi:RNA polymerase sigma factor (sigma-70 family)
MASTDQTLDALIGMARDVSAPTARRHQAFEEIVRRFQDLALACARAQLRDPALAEDAAQDAFLVAWERLKQLRETAAFPGWIRRLVLTQCHRRLRAKRLDLHPESESENVPAAIAPAADVEMADAAALVRLALNERFRPASRRRSESAYRCCSADLVPIEIQPAAPTRSRRSSRARTPSA